MHLPCAAQPVASIYIPFIYLKWFIPIIIRCHSLITKQAAIMAGPNENRQHDPGMCPAIIQDADLPNLVDHLMCAAWVQPACYEGEDNNQAC